MKNDPAVKNFIGTAPNLYPHLKITNEEFPRILATRKIEDDEAEYFGAFLTKTAARILIDFLNRVFRLRSCDIPIDGKFPVPCTQHYHRRCIAPCVESLCDKISYLEMVELVRLFLANRRNELTENLSAKIERASNELAFEAAAHWRDILTAVHEYWSRPRWNVWLDGDVIDTFAIENDNSGLTIYLVTQRSRYVLGRKVFVFRSETTLDEAFQKIAHEFYRFYAPREIRVSEDFAEWKKLSMYLSEKFGRVIPINIVTKSTVRVSTFRAVRLTRNESEIDAAKPIASARTIGAGLKRQFDLKRTPAHIECFDVAHISGRNFVVAWSVWIDGHFVGSRYRFRISAEKSELTSLAGAVSFRLEEDDPPDLILLDGGQTQLNAVLDAIRPFHVDKIDIVAAAKPPGEHSRIAYFLTGSGDRVEFDEMSPAQNMLKLLRDDAHDLANRVHRDLRDMAHNYELASILPSIDEARRRGLLKAAGSIKKLLGLPPGEISNMFGAEAARKINRDIRNYREGKSFQVPPLIVPIRFDDENGGADDLRPIVTR